MRKITKYHKRIRFTFAVSAVCISFFLMLIFNSVGSFASEANYYEVKIGKETVGTSNSLAKAETALNEARMRLSKEADSIVYVDSAFSIKPVNKAFGKTDSLETLSNAIYNKLEDYTNENYIQAVMISADDYSISVDSIDTAQEVLRAIERTGDPNGEYTVNLSIQKMNDFNKISYSVEDSEAISSQIEAKMASEDITRNAASAALHMLNDIGFVDSMEIRNVYTDKASVFKKEAAVEKALADNGIGIKTVVTENYDEPFDGPVQYVEDEGIYAGREQVVFDGVPGMRNVTARVAYVNGMEIGREIVSQEVFQEPEPMIIATGTLPPPTFVQPIDNAFLSSGFGYRWGTMHLGNDYAGPYGEPIYASAAGTVILAQYSDNGYGIQVVIQHDDHIQTRYAHMSELNCQVGDHVAQYQVIGFEGSTGDSTGPHVHFEIIIDGVAVDPFSMLN